MAKGKSKRRAVRRATPRKVKARRNPAQAAPNKRELEKAAQLYERFHGDTPHTVDEVSIPSAPRVYVKVGECIGILYRTRRDGKTENYLHRFTKRQARPTLAASPDGRILYLLGGAYRFTDRGIVDDA